MSKKVFTDKELEERGLPAISFANLYGKWSRNSRESNEVIAIKRGESGYYKTTYGAMDADILNDHFGIGRIEAEAMHAGSMFGWDVPASYPELYMMTADGKVLIKPHDETLGDKREWSDGESE